MTQPPANPYAAPAATSAPADAFTGDDAERFARDRFLLKQKLFAILNETYKVFAEDETVLLHVRRPRKIAGNMLATAVMVVLMIVAFGAGFLAHALIDRTAGAIIGFTIGSILIIGAVAVGILLRPRRHLVFCRDQALSQPVLHVSQDNRLTFPIAWFTLRDSSGTVIARLRKNVLWDLLRRRWTIHAPDGAVRWLAMEDSMLKSLIRRLAPDFIAAFMRTNFVFMDPGSRRILGTFNRKLAFRDHYALDLTADPERQLDRRVAVAAAVLLDTGERR